ncbi:MAG: C39 family peptidase [Ignavibacteria bacterium]|nr:C39 family peptidase [Ignavibacteria bacterium]
MNAVRKHYPFASTAATEVWCWAAAAEMVFKHYGMPNLHPSGNFQCGIVSAWFAGNPYADCGSFRLPVGAMSNEFRVVTEYGLFARSGGIPSRVLSASLIFRPLSKKEIQTEIEAGRPIIVGIAPGGGFALPNASQHIAVIVGYSFESGIDEVVVNDPFPFDYYPFNQNPHPYYRAGALRLSENQYRLSVKALTSMLGWANTIYKIQ